MKFDEILESLNAKFVEELEKGVKPWKSGVIRHGLPSNFFTKKVYKGVNFLSLLNGSFETPYFMTYNQGNELGYPVKKGEKASSIYFPTKCYRRPDGTYLTNKEIRSCTEQELNSLENFVKYVKHGVFNITQFKGGEVLAKEWLENKNKSLFLPQSIIDDFTSCPTIIQQHTQHPVYHMKNDTVVMPTKSQYSSIERWYIDLFHELVHATGHKSRINRGSLINYNTYLEKGREELIAEIGSAYLASMCGIFCDESLDSASSYIDFYIKQIKKDKNFLFDVMKDVQDAVDFIIVGKQSEKIPEFQKQAA